MAVKRENVVLRAYRPFVRILTIYNLKNFTNQSRRILFRNICLAILFTLTHIGCTLSTLSDVWYCHHHAWDLNVISLPFSLLLTVSQVTFSYISLVLNNRLVEEVIDCLQTVIDKRMRFLILF